MKSFLLTVLLIGFSCSTYAARLDLDSHSSHHGQHGDYQSSQRGHDEDFDDVIDKFSKHHWHPHHLFALLSKKGKGGWHSGPYCRDDDNTGGSPTHTPIPAAVWLFGSAVLGLSGLKRKRA